jgi:ArsR family transcriptional regulator
MTPAVTLDLEPKTKRAKGERCSKPVAYPDISSERAQRVAVIAKAGIVRSERQGLWAYYYVIPGALDELAAWLNIPQTRDDIALRVS